MGRCRSLWLAFLLVSLPALAADDAAQATQRIKAVFLFKFAGYVEWPATAFSAPGNPVTIGVVGAEAVARELEQAIAGRSVAGRPLRVRRIPPGAEVINCQILFIGAAVDRARAADLLASAQGQPVLTVTDHSGQRLQGSVINFIEADDRVRFDIFRDAAESNGLQLRSQLLSVARQVVPS